MVTAEIEYQAMLETMPPGAVLTLSEIPWSEYDRLVDELMDERTVRLTYDNGRLEIMTLSPEHEKPAHLLPYLIMVLAEACDLDYLSFGSSTIRKEKKAKGTEPDDCFYFGDFQRVSGKKTIDRSVDPPPDLAFEMDITSGSISKFPIYAAVEVPELWRHDGRRIRFYHLVGEAYEEITHSDLFPFLTPAVLFDYLQIGEANGTIAMVKAFRKWVSANKG
jgi:Uma2 family endonuclease